MVQAGIESANIQPDVCFLDEFEGKKTPGMTLGDEILEERRRWLIPTTLSTKM
jgi:hypothetical protein